MKKILIFLLSVAIFFNAENSFSMSKNNSKVSINNKKKKNKATKSKYLNYQIKNLTDTKINSLISIELTKVKKNYFKKQNPLSEYGVLPIKFDNELNEKALCMGNVYDRLQILYILPLEIQNNYAAVNCQTTKAIIINIESTTKLEDLIKIIIKSPNGKVVYTSNKIGTFINRQDPFIYKIYIVSADYNINL